MFDEVVYEPWTSNGERFYEDEMLENLLRVQPDAIVTELDSYAYLRPMAQLLECRCHGGRLLMSSLGLHELQQYPEARALQSAVYAYLAVPGEAPLQEMTVEEVRALVR